MNALRASFFSITPQSFWNWGRLVLGGAFGIGLLVLVYLAWMGSTEALLFFPVVLILGIATVWMFRHMELNLYLVLAGFVILADAEAGLQVREVLFGIYYLGFLAYWFVWHRAAGTRLLHSFEDRVLMLFLAYAMASVLWAPLFGAPYSLIFSESTVIVLLAFYYPIKEVCIRHGDRAVRALLAVVGWYALFTTVRNLFLYQEALTSAEHLYQITTGRVAMNELYLMMASLGVLVLFLYARRWRNQVALLATFALFFSGLIITQSRGYWGAFLFGAMLLFWIVDWGRKRRIVLLGIVGLLGFIGLGFLIDRDFVLLIIGGILDRFSSLGTASTDDLSLVNRFWEVANVWEWIRVNPLLGYGSGSTFHYFSLVYQRTIEWNFVHNGYVGLWFKYGLIGGGLLMCYWLRSIWLGLKLFRRTDLPRSYRLTGLIALVCLASELLVANTSNPFFMSEGILMFAIFGGMSSGLLHHKGSSAAAPARL